MTTRGSLFKAAAVLCLGMALSCKKSNVETPEPPPVDPPASGNTKQTPTTNRVELTNDSIFLYAQQIYYWNSSLPSYDTYEPRKYTTGSTNLDKYENNLFNLVKTSASPDYVAGQLAPKYSYIFDKANANPQASLKSERMSVDLEGNGNDIGVRLGYYGTTSNFSIFVTAVYPGSPAETAGIKRGDRVTKINGASYGTNFNAQIATIIAAIEQNSVTFEINKSTGETVSVPLTKAIFRSNPIYKQTVITAGTHKIGYLAYARFSSTANSVTELTNAFNFFGQHGVTDLIVDLRYNGGGYVSTAEHLINLIAPSTATGTMYVEHYNQTMKEGKATILKNQPLLDANDKVQFQNGKIVTYADVNYSEAAMTANFAKKGTVTGVRNIVFIVSGSTASASELVINSLKPHMTVQLVGQTTYGKPIGFFPVVLENKYDVYMSLFETKNSRGDGGYYTGMVPEQNLAEISGNSMYDFGDVRDLYLARAVSLLAPGATVTSQGKVSSSLNRTASASSALTLQTELGPQEFKGMIETRHKLR